MFFVSRTTLNALYEKAGLMLRFCGVFVRAHVRVCVGIVSV